MGALITRRSLLTGAVAVGAALSLAGVVHLPAAATGGRVLSELERTVVEHIAEVFFPGAPMPLSGVEAGVAEEVDRILAEVVPPLHATGFRYLLRGLEWGPLYSHGARFTQLGVRERAEVLEIWSDPGILPRRVAFDALRMVMGMAYFRHPEVREAMGYRMLCGGGVA